MTDRVSATVTYHSKVTAAAGSADGREIASDQQSASAVSSDPVGLQGRVLGDFVLGEVLDQGGGGTVYRAEQRALGRSAVVKVVHRSSTIRSDAVERFAREARVASRFDHPYAAHIYSFGVEHDGLMWIAMELVDGTPLGQLIRRSGRLSPPQFVPLFDRLCEVLQSAHDQGIVHRDIKPSNVMVIMRAGRWIPKLLDFGIAKLIDTGGTASLAGPTEQWLDLAPVSAGSPGSIEVSRRLTQDGQLLGSPLYMAPEQWLDPARAGPSADQYALALVAYEALTGTHAFNGRTVEALAQQHREAALPLSADLPPALHAVLARACDKQSERRFASLTDLATAVRAAALGATSAIEEPDFAALEDVDPYPGLTAYTAAHHAVFVGRERDVEELIDRLHAQPIVTVVGPSGSGKTSLLAAGLVPSLAAGWHAEIVRPGSDPPGVLAVIAARRDAPPYREGLHDAAAGSPADIAAGLVGLAEASGVGLVVIVDQAEELFTMCTADAARAAFAEVLVTASASSRVRVVLALRDDFLCRVEQLPAWRRRLGRAVHMLGPPRREELERMLTVPARRRGFTFDDPALPREIVNQVAESPGALPLVAFTAAQLWAHRDRTSRQLTRAAYEQIGGVIGALVRHADSIVDRMSIPERRQVRLIFRRLITAEGTRALLGRSELESALGGSSAAAVIDRLLAARLIVSRDEDAGDRIEIVHETLATTWPRLASWRREDADGVRLQEQLAAAARHWNERDRPADLLWRGDALSDLRRWRERHDGGLTPIEHAFVHACIASAVRRRRIRIALVASCIAIVASGIAGLLSANREIADQRSAALARLRGSFEERGRLAIADGDHTRAVLYLAEAERLGARGPGLDLLTSYAVTSLDGLEILGRHGIGIMGMNIGTTGIITRGSDFSLSRWDGEGRKIRLPGQIYFAALVGDRTVSVSPKGDIVATERDGSVRWQAPGAVIDAGIRSGGGIAGSAIAHLVIAFSKNATMWDVDSGRSRGELPHPDGVTVAAFSADGSRVATGDEAGMVRIWDPVKRELIATCERHAGEVRDIKFARDGRTTVSGGNDGEVRICDAESGATRSRLLGHSYPVTTIDISGDGTAIISASSDGKARLWNARTGLLRQVLEGHRQTVSTARFSPDDRYILTLGHDGTARIWDRDGAALGSLQGHGGPIYAGDWDGDGRHVITTSSDGAIRRWDPAPAIRTAFRQAHADAIRDLVVSRDDRRIFTVGDDGRAVLIDRRSFDVIAELGSGGRLWSIKLAPDDMNALTIDETGRAQIWQLPGGTVTSAFGSAITAATYLHDGSLVTASDNQVSFRTSKGAQLGAVAVGYAVRSLILDPTGRWLFVQGQEKTVVVIDVAARAPVARLEIQEGLARSVAVDGSRVAITDGATIRLWQVGTWAPAGTLVGHKYIVRTLWFLVDGRLVSAAGDATLVWGRDMRLLAKLDDTGHSYALAGSPDGALFATTGRDGMLRVWDAASYRLLLQLPAHRQSAFALRFTHDGTAVISGGNDGRVVTWDLTRRVRSAAELAQIVRCRVPLRLEGDVALPRDLDFDDPECKSLRIR
jgi:WD40 repeat protein/tRNA A-37 threonylcarbamoyl transferase component Bud32